ncbi:hypothetical protein AB8B12_33935, partial [Streptomyces sp. PGLac3x]
MDEQSGRGPPSPLRAAVARRVVGIEAPLPRRLRRGNALHADAVRDAAGRDNEEPGGPPERTAR